MSRSRLKTDSLAFSLLGAARAVAAVKAGGALPQALAQVFSDSAASPQARGAIQDIGYRAMRGLGMAESLLADMTRQPPTSLVLHGLLCCALVLLLGDQDEPAPPYESFTVVDQAVAAAAADSRLAPAKGMVNAVLRRFLRERDVLLAHARAKPVARWNYPDWWISAVRNAYPQQWEAILSAGNRPPPLTLRVNLCKTTPDDYLARLQQAGLAANRIGPVALRLQRPVPVQQLPGFEQGLVSVQDAAAQLAAPLLDLANGMRVLDACAAPGGKTGHMLECADLDLLALDSDAKRLERVRDNLQRLQRHADLRSGDAASADWWDGKPFDRILADVPCTASGIVRRHPDIRWLRRPDDAVQLATLSARILDNLWQMLRPDGKLLLVTCSLWPRESEQQAAAFAARHGALRLPAPGQLLPESGVQQDHDGLFYALFQKTAV